MHHLAAWQFAAAVVLGSWILLCRALRWRRIQTIEERFRGRDPYTLAVDEAQWIVQQTTRLEFPRAAKLSTGFALFRTYGIKTIAEILLRTRQFAEVKTGGKRYIDTGVLISDFTSFPFDSERHAQALARMNYLHSHFNISNDDMLYTLSVFVSVPKLWIEKYDWRPITQMETAAWWILWREIGHQMKIKDIPRTFEEMQQWADRHELRAMLPTEETRQLAETTMGLLLFYIPAWIKPFVKNLLIAIMDDRLRDAMMYPRQPAYIHGFISSFASLRRFLMRNFFLPRLEPVVFTQQMKNRFGRYNINFSDNEPWYLAPESVGRITKFMNYLTGRPNPGPEYRMEGYIYEEVGPARFEGKGQEEMKKDIEEIKARGNVLKRLRPVEAVPPATSSANR